MIIDPPITEEERLELFAINGGGIPRTSIFGLRLLKKLAEIELNVSELKEEQTMTAEELNAMWRELRPQIGNFMCRLDSEVRFIQDRHDAYVTKEEHERKCDECYDSGIDIGRYSRELDYIWLIYQLDEMKEDELVELFGTDCPFDVLKMSCTNGIEEIFDKIYGHTTQKKVNEQWRKIMDYCANDVAAMKEAARRILAEEEAARDASKHEIDEWQTRNQIRLVDEYKHKSHVLHEEYIKKLRDIGLDEDGRPLKEDDE